MTGLDLDERHIVPECPSCGRLIVLTVYAARPIPGGPVVYDGTLARVGLLLHLRKCMGEGQ